MPHVFHIQKAISVGFDRKGDYFGGRSLVEERNNVATIKPTGKVPGMLGMPWGRFFFAKNFYGKHRDKPGNHGKLWKIMIWLKLVSQGYYASI